MMIRKVNEIAEGKSLLFVNKKKQKNFVNQVIANLRGLSWKPIEQKLFAAFF